MYAPLFAHLYVEVVYILASTVDVHAVIVVGVSCQHRPGYHHNGAEHDSLLSVTARASVAAKKKVEIERVGSRWARIRAIRTPVNGGGASSSCLAGTILILSSQDVDWGFSVTQMGKKLSLTCRVDEASKAVIEGNAELHEIIPTLSLNICGKVSSTEKLGFQINLRLTLGITLVAGGKYPVLSPCTLELVCCAGL